MFADLQALIAQLKQAVWDFEEGPVGRDENWSYAAKIQRIKDVVFHMEQFVAGALQAFTDAEQEEPVVDAVPEEEEPFQICVWTLDQPSGAYTTSCDVTFQMHEALPHKKNVPEPPFMAYCCYCGRHLRVTFKASEPVTYWTGFLRKMIGHRKTGIGHVPRQVDEALPTEVVCLIPKASVPPPPKPEPPPLPPKDWWRKI